MITYKEVKTIEPIKTRYRTSKYDVLIRQFLDDDKENVVLEGVDHLRSAYAMLNRLRKRYDNQYTVMMRQGKIYLTKNH